MEKTAEQKWEKEALKCEFITTLTHRGPKQGYVSGYIIGIKDFKQALKEAIEKKREYYKDETESDEDIYRTGQIDACTAILDLIDHVEPKE